MQAAAEAKAAVETKAEAEAKAVAEAKVLFAAAFDSTSQMSLDVKDNHRYTCIGTRAGCGGADRAALQLRARRG